MPEPAVTPHSGPGPGFGRGPVVTPSRVVAGLCLLAPFVAMLWVGSYAKVEPTLAGIPFFYWYQMLWVLISTALTAVAYQLVRREQRARKQGGAR
ncbi:DUF3311 domain-containing protein [Streptomyces sp. MST-110588]|uniref:DUF3311 domain-containing protein n=1 Tax=Streptomyces sp. MST-110588 TaxID=2833628 RepID=UPI001F5C3FA8|nr:DUF3311 domain-containing protein [Streptomyces sp. MST-110588]UNO40014.1 DUF3311 domain-containing protein [Streptomyces sp. MST-110588]